MPITIDGTGSITGLSAGGLPDGSVIAADLATDSVTSAKIAAGAITGDKIADAAISAVDLDGAQSGSAPIYAARAWVNFNGTGTVAIRASGNVSSITDNNVGDYTVNFTTAMPDANYAVSGAGSQPASNSTYPPDIAINTQTTTACNVFTKITGSSQPSTDSAIMTLVFLR